MDPPSGRLLSIVKQNIVTTQNPEKPTAGSKTNKPLPDPPQKKKKKKKHKNPYHFDLDSSMW